MKIDEQEKKKLIDSLSIGVVSVQFEKINGEFRDMKCTLNEEYLPYLPAVDTKGSTKKKSEEAISVWDVNKNEWRSFRFDRVISYQLNFAVI